jgi:cellulose synthase/poly-beta-1,6-N-acetylglucosamine synthase-like glycosyltransferase
MGTTAVQVSVIVPVRDARDDLPALAKALARQTFNGGRSEILFVDNGSADGSVEWLQTNMPPGGRLLHCSHRHNAYAARNAGVEQAVGQILAFTDADCRPADDWLERGVDALRRHVRAAGRIVVQCSRRSTLAEELDASRFLRQQRFVQESFGATANLFVRRQVFSRVGLFDDRLVSGADHEFGSRAGAAGLAIAYAPEAVVNHRARQQFTALFGKAYRVGLGFGQEVSLHALQSATALSRIADRLSLISRAWQRDELGVWRRSALSFGHLTLAVGTAAGCAKGYFGQNRDDTCRPSIRALRERAMCPRGQPASLAQAFLDSDLLTRLGSEP